MRGVPLATLASAALVGILVLSAAGVPSSGLAGAVRTQGTVSYSGVTGYVYADSDGYSATTPLAGATVTIYTNNCISIEELTCVEIGTVTTNATGFFGFNLTSGDEYYASVAPDTIPLPGAPQGFGGAVSNFTAPTGVPLSIDVYPFVGYGNTTFVLPGYACMSAYVDNVEGSGPGCQNPVLSWTSDGVYYVNTSNELVFYSLLDGTVTPIASWVPLYQQFPSYAMIPNQLFITQDGSYIYGWGISAAEPDNLTLEAVNVSTGRSFVYVVPAVTPGDTVFGGEVAMTGWDGNDSQFVLIAEGEVIDHDIWTNFSTDVYNLPYFEANNVYWLPALNGFLDVSAGGTSIDQVSEVQMVGPATNSSDYRLETTYSNYWSTAGIVVNGVNGVSFNVSSRELTVQAENSGLVYAVNPSGTVTQLLEVTNLEQYSDCTCIELGAASESDRPVLTAAGPDLNTNYNGGNNDSWLASLVPGHYGYYSTNVSPYIINLDAPGTSRNSWIQWYQEGQFFNASYLITPTSYACSSGHPGTCTIDGGGGAAVGTINWIWKLGLPELPFAAGAPSSDSLPPGAVAVSSVETAEFGATVNWSVPSGGPILNYTLTWSPSVGGSTDSVSVPGGATSYTIQNLTPGGDYNVAIEAWNLHFHGPQTNATTGDLPPPTKPGAPSGLRVTGSSSTSVSLAWSDPPVATFSNVSLQYGNVTSDVSGEVSVGMATSFTVTGLRPATTYSFSATAWAGTLPGPSSAVASATTANATTGPAPGGGGGISASAPSQDLYLETVGALVAVAAVGVIFLSLRRRPPNASTLRPSPPPPERTDLPLPDQ